MKNLLVVVILMWCGTYTLGAQEFTTGLLVNSAYNGCTPSAYKKTRALLLPFIDDFSYPGPYPKPSHWIDNNVYINNTFGNNIITQGVATFDALNNVGRFYKPFATTSHFADSLTSAEIDLSTYTAADSIYLTFYVQPQGNGFTPEPSDSLFVYYKINNGAWLKVWAMGGTPLTPFTPVSIAVANSIYLHNNFQFRFVNMVSPNSNDDVWQIDYVRLFANRTFNDHILNDVAFTTVQPSILSRYTSMPYRQFNNYKLQELDTTFTINVRNNNTTTGITGVNIICKEVNTNITLASDNVTLNLPANTQSTAQFVMYPFTNFNPPNINTDIILQHRYYYGVPSPNNELNDTITYNYPFSNYYAYDDGSAEKAYYLYSLVNYPASVAMAFKLNEPDTLRGLAVYFAQQIPPATSKKFDIVLYKSLGGTTATQQVLAKQEQVPVLYTSDRNEFTTYGFKEPIVLDSGTYYIGTTQLANTNSDTIYFGLDNTTAANPKQYFINVDGQWKPSEVQATVMMRPLLGQAFVPTTLPNIQSTLKPSFSIYPNPCTTVLQVNNTQATDVQYTIYNTTGIKVSQGNTTGQIDITQLLPGNYFIYLSNTLSTPVVHQFIKQ
jgi:hypothetical protein